MTCRHRCINPLFDSCLNFLVVKVIITDNNVQWLKLIKSWTCTVLTCKCFIFNFYLLIFISFIYLFSYFFLEYIIHIQIKWKSFKKENNFYHRLLWWILKQQLVMFWNQCFLLLYIVCTLKNPLLSLKCNTQEFWWSIQTIEQTEKARMYSCCPTSSFKSSRSVFFFAFREPPLLLLTYRKQTIRWGI
jgi:hypothetical protein